MRDVAVDRGGSSIVRIVVGVLVTLVGVAALLFGLFADVENGIGLVGFGAVVIFVGVALLGPVIARPVSRALGWPLQRIKGTTGELARENASRNPKRTASTAAALMVGVALVGFITIFAASTKESISVAVDRAFRADYVVNTKGAGFAGGFSPELAEQIKELPEIEAVTGMSFNAVEIDGDGHFLAAADPADLLEVLDVDARDPEAFRALAADQLAVSSRAAEDHGWDVGDTVRANYPVGGVRPVEVATLYETGQQEGLTDYFITAEAYRQNYPTQLENIVFARLRPGVTPAEGRRALDTVVDRYPSAEVQDQAEYKQSQEQQIDQLVNLIYALLALAVIIAGIGIANTLALSIVERTRELGLLRAVGMSRRQLKSTIRWEAVIIAMLGTVLGLVIGLFFGWAMVEALKDEGITEFAPPGVQLVVIVLVAALLAVVFAYFPARRAAKLDVLRAIATE
jgi:putative ABC transport system permease protein